MVANRVYIFTVWHMPTLLRAEARFWQNKFAGAADDLNVIRERANAKEMYTAGDVQQGNRGNTG